ncbi:MULTISPECIES: hypothetical protein [unclassified Cryobacterium]|uniref:hypothetical protein n=1 Tax=unclassified Cryobacterium TaxID=2649013 RepID=UPI002AB474A8|nr:MULTISPECIES: hypothetical protein [unclassified Cryobacterium]MDY7527591.1 hypothetical protein [Cryobacterium sp. 10C2]MDY7556627.1 hypothetical protein [Cryobacterium sp. 10C3]MEB0292549.1 hypothetical protein [Cryobacterium sp. 10C2]
MLEALNELSIGVSYAQSSLNVLEKTGHAERHALSHRGSASPDRRPMTSSAADGADVWHLSADLLEQYGPVLYDDVIATIRDQEHIQRLANDSDRAKMLTPTENRATSAN